MIFKVELVAVALIQQAGLNIAEFDWEISYETWLTCPRTNNWGDWGAVEKCPHGTYVKTLQLKVQREQGTKIDDTALNGVRLFCVTFKKAVSIKAATKHIRNITSTVGPLGEWKKPIPCKTGLAVGFKLKSEEDQGRGDDTAANDMRLVCSNKDGTEEQEESTGTKYGDWTETQICIEGSAVCGIQTQVDLKDTDRTSINNVDLICCKLPHPVEFCDPEYSWELVWKESDFSVSEDHNATFTTIEFEIRTIHLYRPNANLNWIYKDFYPDHHKFNITANSFKRLRQKLKRGTRIHRLHSYFTNTHSSFAPKDWNVEINKTVGCEVEIRQLITSCGPFFNRENCFNYTELCKTYSESRIMCNGAVRITVSVCLAAICFIQAILGPFFY